MFEPKGKEVDAKPGGILYLQPFFGGEISMLLFLDIKRPGIRSEYRAFSDCLAQSKIATGQPWQVPYHHNGFCVSIGDICNIIAAALLFSI